MNKRTLLKIRMDFKCDGTELVSRMILDIAKAQQIMREAGYNVGIWVNKQDGQLLIDKERINFTLCISVLQQSPCCQMEFNIWNFTFSKMILDDNWSYKVLEANNLLKIFFCTVLVIFIDVHSLVGLTRDHVSIWKLGN